MCFPITSPRIATDCERMHIVVGCNKHLSIIAHAAEIATFRAVYIYTGRSKYFMQKFHYIAVF